MFPPVRTDLRDALKGLFESLQGCGDYFDGNGVIEEPEPNKFLIKMNMVAAPNEKTRRALVEYTRAYLKECGWTMRSSALEHGSLVMKVLPRR
jgi:hypothetical protein